LLSDCYILTNFTFSEPCILQYICEKDQQDAHFIFLICFIYTILYMFQSKKLIIRRLLLFTQHITVPIITC